MQYRAEDVNYIIFTYISDIALTLLAFFVAYQARILLPYGVRPLTAEEIETPLGLYLLVVIIWTAVFWGMKVYEPRSALRTPEELKTLIPAIGLAAFVFAGALYLSYRDTPRMMFIYFVISDFIFLTGYRGLMYLLLGRTGFWQSRPERVLIVGTGDIARSVAEKMMAKSDPGLLLTGFAAENGDTDAPVGSIPVLGNMADTPAIVDTESIDHIIFALSPNEHRSLKEIILRLYDRPVRIFVVPDVLELAFFRVSMQEWHGIPILGLKEPVITGFARVEKRLFDLIVAAGMLLLLWPVMLVTALAVRLDTPGPIILKQARVGENGSIFTLYKFRSMTQDADRQPVDARQGHKQRGDPRVTRVGRFIRRTSIDELPQLFNVMKGDMSMVGPRPELPAIVENYEPWQYKRFAVPPGITGWWQISGRSDRPMHLHTEDDLYYISHYSPLLDIQILLKTIWVVIKGEGAY